MHVDQERVRPHDLAHDALPALLPRRAPRDDHHAAVAAPAKKPVAASAAACRAGTSVPAGRTASGSGADSAGTG